DQQPNAVAALGALAGGPPKDPVAGAALTQLQSIVTGQWTPPLRQAAVEALSGTRGGTVWLLDLHAKKQLPADLVAQTGQLLRNSPFQGERNRAMLLFPAAGKLNPKGLPPVAELAKRTGDPDRGQK